MIILIFDLINTFNLNSILLSNDIMYASQAKGHTPGNYTLMIQRVGYNTKVGLSIPSKLVKF